MTLITNWAKKKYFVALGTIIGVALLCLCVFIIQYSRAPSPFPRNSIITIPTGSTVSQAGAILEKSGIIRSHIAYRIYTIFIHDGSGIKAGSYLFDSPQSVLRVAFRTAYGVQDLTKIKVTIPEGSDSRSITKLLNKNISGFATSTFYTLAKSNEGYLFPDTYYFYQNTTPDQVIDAMRENFNEQTVSLGTSTSAFAAQNNVSYDQIVTMASIVEKEATTLADRQIIAGILWRRFADRYPLQVDPPFYYFLNKNSSQLTLADLAVDSPYNLYKHKGLTPTPIDNPGLDALFATVNPTTTKYWYYLSDAKGVMHYAATYDQHLANKAKYLN